MQGRATLSQGLDKDVYAIVVELAGALAEHNEDHLLKLPRVYEHIRKSNSSLNRKNTKLLEDSIARVLNVMKQDAASGDEMDSISGEPDDFEATRTLAANHINKSMTSSWGNDISKTNGVRNPSAKEQGLPPAVAPSSKRQSNGDPPAKRCKVAASVDRTPPTHVNCEDLGGADEVIKELMDLMVLPLLQPETYTKSKIQPPRGILLHGPPGCGKTMVAHAFASELGVPFIPISAPSIVSGMSGESEKALREHFEEAKKLAPCLIFIDEIDSITPKRESAQREMEKRIVAQLLTCMDELILEKTGGKAVIVLAATNRPDSLDPALRRGGRFDKEINLGVPNEAVREQILRAMTRDMLLLKGFPFRELAKQTPGFVGADLKDLVSTAGAAAIKRYLGTLKTDGKAMEIADSNDMELDNERTSGSQTVVELRRLIKRAREPSSEDDAAIHITIDDFQIALPKIQPSAKREGFATIPETTWAQIGALGPVREELLTAIVEPIRSPEKYERVGITAPTGVLLWGPPGCGKTLLAKAVANESRANFISVKGPELLNKYVGESEKAVLKVFERARSSVPCVIFFDELDALVPKRDESLSESSARVVNTLLTELDGLSNRRGIYVIAATNRPDIIDPAMLRPGRLETLLFVDLPEAAERVDILRTLCSNTRTKFDVNIGGIAEKCEGFSGADLEKLLKQAGYAAIKRNDKRNDRTNEGIIYEDFVNARGKVGPSVSDRRKYDRLKAQWGAGL